MLEPLAPVVRAYTHPARVVSEKDVARHQRAVRLQPDDDLLEPRGRDSLQAGDLVDRPIGGSVALDDLRGAPNVVGDGGQHDRRPEPLDVAVERPPEAVARRLLRGHEGVDRHDPAIELAVDATHHRVPVVGVRRCPLRMAHRPTPQSRRKLSDLHRQSL